MHTFSREAIERPYRTVEAARIVREKAEIIARVATNAHTDEVVVVVVDHDLHFGGVWTLAIEDFARQLHIVEDAGGWSLTFSHNVSVADIEARCDELARIAQKRGAIMLRWVQRHHADRS